MSCDIGMSPTYGLIEYPDYREHFERMLEDLAQARERGWDRDAAGIERDLISQAKDMGEGTFVAAAGLAVTVTRGPGHHLCAIIEPY